MVELFEKAQTEEGKAAIEFENKMVDIALCSISREKMQSHVLNGSNVVTTCVSARSSRVQFFNDRGVKVFIPDTFLHYIALICCRPHQPDTGFHPKY